jgi:hypothetical protein
VFDPVGLLGLLHWYGVSKPRRRIVIAAANFAGVTAARHLGSGHAVTGIDRSPWFEGLGATP